MELRAQLHMHTTESKGTRVKMHSNIYPKTAIDILKKKNIQVAAITDHDNTRAYPKIKDYAEKNGIILINGIEITTRDGEIIGLNVEPGIEKEFNRKMSVLEARDIVLDHAGKILIPHPFDTMRHGIGKKIKDVKGTIEIFNPGNIFGFEDKLAKIIAEKLNLPIVACSDAHWIDMIDRGITVIDSEPDINSIFKAIEKRKVRFENCRYTTWKEIKKWTFTRISDSYLDIMDHLKNGWEIDTEYMKIANQGLIRLIQKKTLQSGISKPDNRTWSVISYIVFFLSNLYALRARRKYGPFVFSL